MPIAMQVLAMGEESLRGNEVKIVLGARHSDIEQTPLYLDLGGRPGAEAGGDAAIDDVEHEDSLDQAVTLSKFTPRSHSTMVLGLLRLACHQRSRYSPATGSCAIQLGTGISSCRS
jgi:hypothetical protein